MADDAGFIGYLAGAAAFWADALDAEAALAKGDCAAAFAFGAGMQCGSGLGAGTVAVGAAKT